MLTKIHNRNRIYSTKVGKGEKEKIILFILLFREIATLYGRQTTDFQR